MYRGSDAVGESGRREFEFCLHCNGRPQVSFRLGPKGGTPAAAAAALPPPADAAAAAAPAPGRRQRGEVITLVDDDLMIIEESPSAPAAAAADEIMEVAPDPCVVTVKSVPLRVRAVKVRTTQQVVDALFEDEMEEDAKGKVLGKVVRGATGAAVDFGGLSLEVR